MVTEYFHKIVNTYIDRLNGILTIDKEEYREGYSRVTSELYSELDKLQDSHPLLAYYDFDKIANNPEKYIKSIKKNVEGKTRLDCVATCEAHPFKFSMPMIKEFGRFNLQQPCVINLDEKPNIVITSSSLITEADYLKELLMSIILSMPIGEVHVSFVNTTLSGKARGFMQNVNKSAFDAYANDEEVNLITHLLNKRFEDRIVKGKNEGAHCIVVVLLDFDLHQRKYDDFSTLFERGNEAGIHFVIVANKDDISQARTFEEDNLLKCDNYHLLNQDPQAIQTIFVGNNNFAQSCYEYIDQGFSHITNGEWSEDIVRDIKSKLEQEQRANEMKRISEEREREREEEERRREIEEERRREESMVKVRFWCRLVKGFDDNEDSYSKVDVIDRDVYLSLLQGGSKTIANYILSEYLMIGRDWSIVEATMEKW